jgi:hypothetical protein
MKFRASINGNWRVIDTSPFRAIDVPKDVTPTILLPHGMRNSQQSLEELVHECLHAAYYYSPEKKVEIAGGKIAERLWGLGLRLKLLHNPRNTKVPMKLVREMDYALYTLAGITKEQVAKDLSKVLWRSGWRFKT